MSEVFLAYKSVDRDRANVVRAKLEALGVALFIDQKLLSDDSYIAAINKELETALAVLVLWTEAAIRTSEPGKLNFVLSEAHHGYARGVLVAATLDKIVLDRLPVPFNVFNASDISDWLQTGTLATHPEWQKILLALGKKLDRPGLASLAIALESNDEQLKKEFLKNFHSDRSAQQIAAGLEAFERKQFEDRISTARKRISQRSKEAEKKLKSCRETFEAQIAELRAGRDFMPPDPVAALNDNVARLKEQIEIYENTLRDERARADQAEAKAASSMAELTALKEEHAKAGADNDSDAPTLEEQIAELHTTSSAALKQRSQRETRRLIRWSGSAAFAAVCLGGLAGWWLTPTVAVQPAADVQQLNSQIADLKGQIQAWQKRQSDLETQRQQLANQQAELNKQKADLSQQQNALTADKAKFDQQQQDFNKAKATLDQQQADLDRKQKQFALQSAPNGPLSAVAQCDALAGYQYDPDRPPNSGWTKSSKDIPVAAQAICESALQTTGDPSTQRRIKLETGRAYLTAQLEKTLAYWDQAAKLGSSQALFVLGREYYGDRRNHGQTFNAKAAWDNVMKAADLDNPSALYSVAYNNLFPNDDNNILPSERADPATGEEYLRKALNADLSGAAYWIAGVHYWKTNRDLATNYLTTSFCVKHYVDKGSDGDSFYLAKTGHHLSCQ